MKETLQISTLLVKSEDRNSPVDELTSHQDDAIQGQGTRSRAGRVIRKPARYCMTVKSQGKGECKGKITR